MEQPFIGMGKSPDGIELPLGLSMGLTMHPDAAETFGKMSIAEKQSAIRYVQSGVSGEDAKRRIRNAVSQMEQGRTAIS